MSLTVGQGLFGHSPTARFNQRMPEPSGLFFIQPSPKWLRAKLGGETIADTRQAALLYRHGSLPLYLVPLADVAAGALSADDVPAVDASVLGESRAWTIRSGGEERPGGARTYSHELLAGLVELDWYAIDEWWEEGEQLQVHPHDPYHRIDVLASPRRLNVSVQGIKLAQTTRAKALFETTLPPRWYIPREDVAMDLLSPSDRRSSCAYKGHAGYFSLDADGVSEADIARTYEDPWREALPVKDHICFFDERVDLELDGELQERPVTPWSQGFPDDFPRGELA